MNRVRIGFIGAGSFITAYHLLTAHHSPSMEIRAIADLDEAKLAEHKKKFNIGYVTTDYRKLLQDPQIDIICVGTKQDLHSRFIVESLRAGKWVYCEKPMAETDEQCDAVLAAEQDSPGRLAIGYNRRFAPAYQQTKSLMQRAPRPWFLNYRLMWPNPAKDNPNDFYANQPHILYEGCHILDLACWLLDAVPKRVMMTGDRYRNNCCILDYPDGSQVSFMCGVLGTYCMWKEYLEVFANYQAITVSDFVDMRVRGIEGEGDRVFSTYLGEHEKEVLRYGFDFYEVYRVDRIHEHAADYRKQGMIIEPVRRPTPLAFDPSKYGPENTEAWSFVPDKGWSEAFNDFARCFLEGREPEHADATAGVWSTRIALALLQSLETGTIVELSPSLNPHRAAYPVQA